MLKIQGLVLKNGKRALLRNISLTAEAGTLTLITGGTGSGKSLLLHALAEIEDFDLGLITLWGKKLCPRVCKKHVLYWQDVLTAPIPERKLHGKQLLLLDEPFRTLNAQARKDMLQYLRALAEKGMIILLTAADAMPFALDVDQIALLHEGKLLQCASPDDMYAQPADLITARYLGECNAFSGVVSGVSNRHQRTALDVDGMTLDCPGREYTEVGDAMTLCVRAEHTHVSLTPVPFGQNVCGVVVHNTWRFGTQEIRVQLPSGQEIISLRQKETPDDFNIGDKAFLYWDIRKSHLFP